jgi:predicted ATP-dependent serine protease
MPGPAKDQSPLASSGVAGLDDVLSGGFVRRRLYLVEGVPGSGKTTLALQFLLAGAAAGESVLYTGAVVLTGWRSRCRCPAGSAYSRRR